MRLLFPSLVFVVSLTASMAIAKPMMPVDKPVLTTLVAVNGATEKPKPQTTTQHIVKPIYQGGKPKPIARPMGPAPVKPVAPMTDTVVPHPIPKPIVNGTKPILQGGDKPVTVITPHVQTPSTQGNNTRLATNVRQVDSLNNTRSVEKTDQKKRNPDAAQHTCFSQNVGTLKGEPFAIHAAYLDKADARIVMGEGHTGPKDPTRLSVFVNEDGIITDMMCI